MADRENKDTFHGREQRIATDLLAGIAQIKV